MLYYSNFFNIPLLLVLWSETDAMGGKYPPKYVLKNIVWCEPVTSQAGKQVYTFR